MQNLHVKAQEREEEKLEAWREYPLKERLENALIKGVGDHLEEDLKEALKEYPRVGGYYRRTADGWNE